MDTSFGNHEVHMMIDDALSFVKCLFLYATKPMPHSVVDQVPTTIT